MIKLSQNQYQKLIDYLTYVESGIYPMLENFFKNVLNINVSIDEIKEYLINKDLAVFDDKRRLWYAKVEK